jgi:hypothetical protein
VGGVSAPAPPLAEAGEFQPGVYDMPDHVYHADPVPGGSLSSSGARKLLPPSCPALFKYELDHKRPPKKEFDLGHAAHQLVLGTGPELVVVDRERWDTKECKAEVAAIRERGAVPLKSAEYAIVKAMAGAIRQHPIAGALFSPDRGEAEQSLFWHDRRFGIWRRARLDWLPNPGSGRMVIADYKTAASAAPDKFQRSMHDFGYAAQASFYLDGVRALGLADKSATFVFVVQERTPPFLVTVIQPDPTAFQIGDYLNQEAMRVYAECKASDRWPGYSDGVELVSLPRWVEAQFSKELSW